MQADLWQELSWRNIVLKARQLGCTTLIQLFYLARMLFRPRTAIGIIAQNNDAAADFFENKFKYAYERLPKWVLASPGVKLKSDRQMRLKLANDSYAKIGAKLRSGTFSGLHISEYAALCNERPKVAEEVISGAMNTLVKGGMAVNESTAVAVNITEEDIKRRNRREEKKKSTIEELRDKGVNDFYLRYKEAEETAILVEQGLYKYGELDWKPHFYPWMYDPEYIADDPPPGGFNDKELKYFDDLGLEHEIELTDVQKNFHAAKDREQKEKMKQEFPTYPDEAFHKEIKGAIFAKHMRKHLKPGINICELPYHNKIPVNIIWDLGIDDAMAIWFHQRVGAWDHFIDYLEGTDEDITFYIEIIKEKGYNAGMSILPHDGAHRNYRMKGTAEDIIRQNTNYFPYVCEKVQNKKFSIDLARQAFAHCRFDINNCAIGLRQLRTYRWALKKGIIKPAPTPAAHGADAFQQFALYLSENGNFTYIDPARTMNPYETGGKILNPNSGYGHGNIHDPRHHTRNLNPRGEYYEPEGDSHVV